MQLSSSSVSSTAGTGASGGGSSASEIERLQRQLKNLQKSMADLPNQGLPPDQAKEQAQLLSQQIQIVQAQIARLQAQKSLEQAQTQLENLHSESSSSQTEVAAKARTTDKVTGSSSLTDARLQAQKAAQATHPASAEAIEPAEPPWFQSGSDGRSSAAALL
ncbi:flxA-like family protein [Ralstonia insidiosa]|uniref:FlxA-like family protein n=1 Tax=Ralstonia insidiosa TaxID=190721 RepID=A0AAC9BK59_9RALS|nr:FlxA-like family protein [Ralstonia insidiosa]ANH75657.1 flxA-like family protein [Ralstonia insidiosa]